MQLNKTKCFLAILVLCFSSRVAALDYGTISVTGKGEVKLPPDQVTVTIGVYTRNVNLDQVRGETDTRVSTIIAVLKDQDIQDQDIQSSYTSLQPHFPEPATENEQEEEIEIDGTKPDYYEAQKAITFILKNISNYDRVMAGLYAAGINSVDGVTFGLQDDKKAMLEARKRAIAKAKEIATVIADGLGLRLSYAYATTDNPEQDWSSGGFVAMGDEGGSFSGPSIAGGQIVVSSSVSVNFYAYPQY